MERAFRYPVRVEFADTDAAGVAHFSRLLTFIEAAEHAYLKSLGIGVFTDEAGVRSGWPRVDVNFQFRSPMRFGDEGEVAIWLEELGRKSVRYRAELMSAAGRVVCAGTMTNAYVEIGGDFAVKSSEICSSDRQLFLKELERLGGSEV
ncbi:acyl-CoA thioesterase [Sulfuriroseicoccus oceanibius]|uniref:Acyl-CoA thioesterase n=1 Tax=Sulfuriroseicoccus oceanibius TaxID=2707525 RepID=A0A6B3L7I6_9BACT|nr:thioesterase family protein [Sulfuriroseicoccus oceanibius]QQL44292.1 acyl-CoA thioesterase [Sulfuriroseicoccus oceanibius]